MRLDEIMQFKEEYAPSIIIPARTTSLLTARKKMGWGDTVQGDFWCQNNNIDSLVGAPREVGGSFYCDHTDITSLEGAPIKVGASFGCFFTKIRSLKGAPIKVGEYFWCHRTDITSLEGIGNHFKDGYIRRELWIPDTMQSHLLGLLLIPELKLVTACFNPNEKLEQVTEIINKHFKLDKDILECQEELYVAGLKEYGRL